jgi:RNA polymerase sigma-70 factor (ECF subfamily)
VDRFGGGEHPKGEDDSTANQNPSLHGQPPVSSTQEAHGIFPGGRKNPVAPSNTVVISRKGQDVTPAVIDACRRGDRDGFRVLYEAYKDKVYSIALYFFHGDTAMAADVTQHVFLKLMGSMAQFRGDSTFSTWLYRFVVNACVDTTRSRSARADMIDPALLDTLPAADSLEDALANAQIAGSVRAAVSSLAPKLRIAILLRYFEDLSYAEMADVLQCSMGTVASRLSRGHEILARRLARFRNVADKAR